MVVGGVAIFAVAVFFLNGDMILANVGSIFNFDSNASNLERMFQFDALVQGICDNPVFGAGAGAVAAYSRSDTQPWAYELYYIAVAFQYGLIAFIIYSSGIMYLLWNQAKCACSKTLDEPSRLFFVCFLSGFISFIISSATNPYLCTFDYMWVIFIPVIMINAKNTQGAV